MVLRNRDSRRLRVMLDESSVERSADSETLATTNREKKSLHSSKTRRLYGYGAERRSQPKTTDLIPKRWFAYSTVVLVLIAAVGALNGLSIYSTALHAYLGDAGVNAFSLRGAGTLASWFTSVLLALAAAYCLQVHCLRKHRCDDYRGSYRVWRWSFCVFAMASVAATVDLGQISQNVLKATAGGENSFGPVSILSLVGCVALTTMVALATWEVRVSRGSMALVGLSWLAGSVSVLSVEPFVRNQFAESSLVLIRANASLAFSVCSFLAVVTYARYVYLAANGMLPVRQVKPKPSPVNKIPNQGGAKTSTKKTSQPVPAVAASSKPKAKPVAKEKPNPVTNPSAGLLPRAEKKPVVAPNRMDEIRKRAAIQKATQSDGVSDQGAVAEDASAASMKLSKAERRRQRKLDRRQKRAA